MNIVNESISNASSLLEGKLKNFKLDNIEISDYNKRYFGSLIKNKQSLKLNLNKYSYLLKLALSKYNYNSNNKPVFLDYGSGHGMMTLLAKQTGLFSKVIYSDIFEQSAIDAKTIASNLNLKSDYYIIGDVHEIIEFSVKHAIKFNIMTSYDVLEHIYDIEDFILNLKLIFDSNFSFVMGSGANSLNPLISKRLRKLHFNFENFDREEIFGRKSTDTTLSLKKQRKSIITDFYLSHGINLTNNELEYLILNTRGLIQNDIKMCLAEYLESGTFNYTPDDPTNTCDSLTGNWFERLMNPYTLKRKFNNSFNKIYVDIGFYYSIITNKYFLPKSLINILMCILPKKLSIKLSPFYIIHGINE